MNRRKLSLLVYSVGSNSPPHPGKAPIPHPRGTYNSQMPVGCPQGDVEALNRSAHNSRAFLVI